MKLKNQDPAIRVETATGAAGLKWLGGMEVCLPGALLARNVAAQAAIKEHKMNVNPEILHSMIYRLSRNEWEQVRPSSWNEIEHMADELTVLAAEVAIYAYWRGGGNGSDYGHDKAIEQAKIMREKMRKLLGYSYP